MSSGGWPCRHWTVGGSSLSHPPCPPAQPLQNKASGWRERGLRTLTPAQTHAPAAPSSAPGALTLRLPHCYSLVFWGQTPAWGTSEKKHAKMPGWVWVPSPWQRPLWPEPPWGSAQDARQRAHRRVPLPSLEALPPRRHCPMLREYTVDQEKDIDVGALTGLQGGQWFRLLAELTVPNVIGRLHAKLVGRERLEPRGG